jgi:hypothetical protein
MSRLAVWEAVSHNTSSPIWQVQVVLDHGLDINAPLEDCQPPPLASVLEPSSVISFFGPSSAV